MKILSKPTIERVDSNLAVLIHISLTDGEEAERFIEGIDAGDYKLFASKLRQHRSLNANAYMWVLCDKIAQKLRISKTEVYKHAIREVGVFHDMAVSDRDVAEVKRVWESNGIGWFTEEFHSRLFGCKRVRFYHGSSLYDTAQMSRLIDYINDQALELGIETETEENIKKMMEHWNGNL